MSTRCVFYGRGWTLAVRLLFMGMSLYRLVGEKWCLSFLFGGDQNSLWPLRDVLVLIISLGSHLFRSAEGFSLMFIFTCVCLGCILYRAPWGLSLLGFACDIWDDFRILEWVLRRDLYVWCLLSLGQQVALMRRC